MSEEASSGPVRPVETGHGSADDVPAATSPEGLPSDLPVYVYGAGSCGRLWLGELEARNAGHGRPLLGGETGAGVRRDWSRTGKAGSLPCIGILEPV